MRHHLCLTLISLLALLLSMFRLAAVGQSRQELPEELPELCVEDGVDDGVEGAVHVAQPGHDTNDKARDFTVLAKSPHRVHYEERRPAEQEGTCGWTNVRLTRSERGWQVLSVLYRAQVQHWHVP